MTCRGDGGRFGSVEWIRCIVCDGIGDTWKPGGPSFGCSIKLGDREPGELVELGSGERAVISWHQPRPTKKEPAITTFVRLFDDFTEELCRDPVPVTSAIGVRSVAAAKPHVNDDGTGHKNTDTVDPLNRNRNRALL